MSSSFVMSMIFYLKSSNFQINFSHSQRFQTILDFCYLIISLMFQKVFFIKFLCAVEYLIYKQRRSYVKDNNNLLCEKQSNYYIELIRLINLKEHSGYLLAVNCQLLLQSTTVDSLFSLRSYANSLIDIASGMCL